MSLTPLVDRADERIVALANEITGDWPKVIAVWEEFRTRYQYYLRADLEADPLEFLKQALWAAHGGQHLRALLARFSESKLTSPSFAAAATAIFGTDFILHSYINGRWQSQDALLGGRRFMEACDHICRIAIDDKHCGTGVLVRPTIIATAAHVVAPLVGPAGIMVPDSLRRLSIAFVNTDALHFDNDRGSAAPTEAQLHEQWLGYYSPPATGEGEAFYPIDGVNGIAHEIGPWDLALLRIARQPRPGLNGYRPCEDDPPAPCFGVHVIHYPADALGASMPLLWSIGEIRQGLGHPKPLRWLHDANTDGGSSGAPCFDNAWRIVGLHQAGSQALSAANQNNRAVPVYPWAGRIDSLVKDIEDIPYLVQVEAPNGRAIPVFGRRELQSRVWKAMSGTAPDFKRTFLIMGDQGSGKSFTAKIISALAKRAGCRFASLDIRNTHGETSLAFAQRIIGALGGSLSLPPEPAGMTTGLRLLQNEIIPRLVQELEAVADGRPLWLVLDGLELCDSAADEIGELINGLIAALVTAPYLHLVLLGWKGPLQAGFAEVLASEPTIDDILSNLLQSLTPPGSVLEADIITTFRVLIRSSLESQSEETAYARATAAMAATKAVVTMVLARRINTASEVEAAAR